MKKLLKPLTLTLSLMLAMPPLTACEQKKTGATLEISMNNSWRSEYVAEIPLVWVEKQIAVENGLVLVGSLDSYEAILHVDTRTGTVTQPELAGSDFGTMMDITAAPDGTLRVFYVNAYSNEEGEQRDICMCTYDAQLNLLEQQELPDAPEQFWWSETAIDKDGNYMVWTYNDILQSQSVEVFDKDFQHLGSISDGVESIGYFYYSASGDVYTNYTVAGGAERFVMVDAENLSFVPVTLPDTLIDRHYPIAGENGSDFSYLTENGIYAVNLAERSAEEILNWMNSDMDAWGNVTSTGDGGFFVTTANRNEGFDLWKCCPRTQEEINGIQYITMAAYEPYSALDMVQNFNRTSTEYRIIVEDYSKYNTESDADAGLDRFKSDMLSGKIADIICTENLPFAMMADKGMFEDLTPFMERDLNAEDYYTNFFDSVSYVGKQYQIGFSFTVGTLAAKEEYVGTQEGYSIAEFIDLLESLPEEIPPFSDADKMIMLRQMCIFNNLGAFVDTKARTCRFDSEEFISLLELCNTFPDTVPAPESGTLEWMELMDSRADDFLKDEAVFLYAHFGGPESFHKIIDGNFGGETVTFTGYPKAGESGNGAVFEPDFLLAMNAQSRYQEEIWEIMKTMLSEETQRSIGGVPVLRSVLPEKIAAYLEEPAKSWYGGPQLMVKLDPPTQEQMERFADYIEEIDARSYTDQTIRNIIEEEAEMYFAGDSTAQECAEMIQSRVSLYLSEQS